MIIRICVLSLLNLGRLGLFFEYEDRKKVYV